MFSSGRSVLELVRFYHDRFDSLSNAERQLIKKEASAKVFGGPSGPNPVNFSLMSTLGESWAMKEMEVNTLCRMFDLEHPSVFWIETMNDRFSGSGLPGDQDIVMDFEDKDQSTLQEELVRQTGRTTRRVLEAINELVGNDQYREVRFVGHTRHTADYIKEKFDNFWSGGLGEDCQLDFYTSSWNYHDWRHFSDMEDVLLVEDHTSIFNENHPDWSAQTDPIPFEYLH